MRSVKTENTFSKCQLQYLQNSNHNDSDNLRHQNDDRRCTGNNASAVELRRIVDIRNAVVILPCQKALIKQYHVNENCKKFCHDKRCVIKTERQSSYIDKYDGLNQHHNADDGNGAHGNKDIIRKEPQIRAVFH